jgi:hypothetical protein
MLFSTLSYRLTANSIRETLGMENSMEARGQGQGIAVIAACRDAIAAGDRVPGDLCPTQLLSG